jgi:hypothetical protein
MRIFSPSFARSSPDTDAFGRPGPPYCDFPQLPLQSNVCSPTDLAKILADTSMNAPILQLEIFERLLMRDVEKLCR